MTKQLTFKSMFFILSIIILFSVMCVSLAAAEQNDGHFVLVQDGQAKAIVVVADDASEEALEAANILVEYVAKSTGVTFNIQTAGEVEDAQHDGQTFIYIGQDDTLNAYLQETLGQMDPDGFIMYPHENSLSIVGPTARGTRNGVVDFLERYVGVIWLMPGDAWEDVPQHHTLIVPRKEIIEEPDFTFRSINMGASGAARHARDKWRHLNRLQEPRELESAHNLRALFPPEKYGESNPEFYPKGQPPAPGQTHGWQPCFTVEGTVDAAVEGILEYFAENPNASSFSLSANDGAGYCEQDPSHPDYPGKSNSVGRLHMSELYFGWVNQIVEQVAEVHPDKWFGAYAYMDTMDPPAFELHPNIVPVITKDRLTWIDGEVRAQGHQHLKDWEQVSSQTGFYEYPYGVMYFLPRVFPRVMAENYQFSKEQGVMAHHADMHQVLGDGPKPWIAAKFQWDVDQDVEQLLNLWYERAVGPEAAPDLEAYFDLWEDFWTERIKQSEWFQDTKHETYLSLNTYSYLNLVTEEDINESRRLLESVVDKAETPQQLKRAELLLRQFEFYEASALSYPKKIEPITHEEKAFEVLDYAVHTLDTRELMAQKRYDLIEQFNDEPSLMYPSDPFRRGGTWTGWNPYEYWNLVHYMKDYEPSGGPITDQVKDLTRLPEATTLREFARLLQADLPSSRTENPSFEEGNEAAASWTFWNPDRSAEIQRIEGVAHTGESSIRVDTSQRAGVYQILPIKSGLLASQVHFRTPEGTVSDGTIQIVIEAFNDAGDKIVYRSDSVNLSESAGEWASVGFLENIPETINNREVTEILLNAQILNPSETLYVDDIVVYQYESSVADLLGLVERFDEDGEFTNSRAARDLRLHLTSLALFESQGETNKVLQHMKGFYLLLEQQNANDWISELAYHSLKSEAQTYIGTFIGAEIDMQQIFANQSGDYPITLYVSNHTDQSQDITLQVETPEQISLQIEPSIQLEAGQSTERQGTVHIPADLPEGEYEVTISVLAGGTVVQVIPVTIHYTTNLLVNASFEMQSNNLPHYWRAKDDWVTGAVTLSPDAARSGDFGIKMQTETTDDYWIMQNDVTVEGGKAYNLDAWVKSEISPNGRVQMKVEFYHNANGWIGDVWSDEFGSFDEWEEINVWAQAPKEANRARIFLRLYGPGTVSYDDISFKLDETIDYDNLVGNPGFEELSINGEPNLWRAKNNWSTEAVEVSSEARNGNIAIRMQSDSTDDYWIMQQHIEVESGEMYELSAWLKSDISDGGRARMKFEFYHHTDGWIGDVWSPEYGSYDDWEKVSAVAEAPAGANRVRIFLRLYGPGTALFDDVSVRLLAD